MARWTGVLGVAPGGGGGALFKVAASLYLSAAGTSLAAPSINAVFFTGDRVEGTGNKTIEDLSDSTNLARLLVSKLGGEAAAVNAWVINAAAFSGPFAVYKEFVPTVNFCGDPQGYDPTGLPASKSIVSLLSQFIRQVNATLGDRQQEPRGIHPCPSTMLIGFSKGGIILNQILSEISSMEHESIVHADFMGDTLFPKSEGEFLQSISAFHFVDVGLNCPGAYLTEPAMIKRIVENLHNWDSRKPVKFVLHGTPRQWRDRRRPWICEEKDKLAQLLRKEEAFNGRISFKEVMYFSNILPSLQMHFEIIKSMQLV